MFGKCKGDAAVAVQALERLVSTAQGSNDSLASVGAFESVRSALVEAKGAKQQLEELSCGITAELNKERSLYAAAEVADLKKKVIFTRASKITEEEREALHKELVSLEEKSGRDVLFAVLETNPWYDAVFSERMASSRKNSLFFVFRRQNHLFLSHRGAKAEVTESVGVEVRASECSWLEGRELRWFAQQMVGGSNSRVLNALLSSIAHAQGKVVNGSAVICMGNAWNSLLAIVCKDDCNHRLISKRLLSVTLAQASNAVSERDCRVKLDKKAARMAQMKKQKRAKEGIAEAFALPLHLRLKAAARDDIFLFCHAFSLLSTVERQLTTSTWDGSPPAPEEEGIRGAIREAWERVQMVKSAVKPAIEDNLFFSLRQTADLLTLAIEKSPLPEKLSKCLGKELEDWMKETREKPLEMELCRALALRSDLGEDAVIADGLVKACHIVCNTEEKLAALLEVIGTPLTQQKGSLVYLAEGGSRMYNLSTPESDSDFVGVFLWDPARVVSSISAMKESAENKGKQARIEHSCFEARMMADMLLKGNPNVIELLFAPSAHYASDDFEYLRKHRRKLISEYVVVQYDSWVKWHVARIARGDKAERASKLFYHALHKLAGLQCLARGEEPIVVMQDGPNALSDEEICPSITAGTITRDIILRIRKGPLVGPLALECVLEAVTTLHTNVRAQLRARDWRYPEWGDQGLLTHWLLRMRLRSFLSGLSTSDSLTWTLDSGA